MYESLTHLTGFEDMEAAGFKRKQGEAETWYSERTTEVIGEATPD